MTSRRLDTTPPAADRVISAQARVMICGLIGVAVGILADALTSWRYGVLVGWDIASATFMTWVWATVWPLDGRSTRRLSEREDPTRATADLVLLVAAVSSLVAVGFVLASAAHAIGSTQLLRVSLGLASVVLSWAVVHTVFTLRYARMYYAGSDGGVEFDDNGPPSYRDFAYLAFTIGMTFQVSDTPLEDADIRATALQHALLSFVFSTGILAATINLVASLGSKG
jgi:uncharacterized membrane protein